MVNRSWPAPVDSHSILNFNFVIRQRPPIPAQQIECFLYFDFFRPDEKDELNAAVQQRLGKIGRLFYSPSPVDEPAKASWPAPEAAEA